MASEERGFSSDFVFLKLGSIWLARFAGQESLLCEILGFYYLRDLLRQPGVGIPPLELVLTVRGALVDLGITQQQSILRAGTRTEQVLDRRYVSECRRRLSEIHEELKEAVAENDLGRIEALQEEKGDIESVLERGLGLGNRPRERSPAENARCSVKRAIDRARRRIGEENKALGRHLRRSIHTGSLCMYEPDDLLGITWTTRLAAGSPAQGAILDLLQTR